MLKVTYLNNAIYYSTAHNNEEHGCVKLDNPLRRYVKLIGNSAYACISSNPIVPTILSIYPLAILIMGECKRLFLFGILNTLAVVFAKISY